jgi:hypothetical protein
MVENIIPRTRSQITALLAFATVLSTSHGVMAETLYLTAAHMIDTTAGKVSNEIGLIAKGNRADTTSFQNNFTSDVKNLERTSFVMVGEKNNRFTPHIAKHFNLTDPVDNLCLIRLT